MRFEHHRCDGAAQGLWLMLPGAYMAPQDFIAAGFVDALRARGLRHDVGLLDANVAQVADGSALRGLQHYLINDAPPGVPVRLLGISLGAQLALACLACVKAPGPLPGAPAAAPQEAAQAAARVTAAVLLAPYLGPRNVVGEVAAAGLAAWSPGAMPDNDIDRQVWHWVQQHAQRHSLYLGYGREDRFAPAHALLGQALPPHCVDVQPGGHDWPAWTLLWQRYLDRFESRAHGG